MTDVQRLSRRTLALFAAPCLGLAGIGLPLTVYLPNFYADQLGMDLGAVGAVFMAVRLLDIGVDPVLGVLMDRTRTRVGRFRPWLAAGTPLLMLASGWLCFARPGVSPLYLAIGLILAYAGWSICVLAQSAWGALLSPSYNERSRIYGWWQVSNLIGLLLILLLPVAAQAVAPSPTIGVRAMGGYLILALPLSAALAIGWVAEPDPAASAWRARMSDWAKLLQSSAVRRILGVDLVIGLAFGVEGALFLFFFTKAKGFTPAFANIGLLLFFLGALAGVPLWTGLSRWASKHAALGASCLFNLAGLLCLYLIPHGQQAWAMGAALVSGLSYAASNQITRALMADAGDEERLKSGVDRIGLLYAILNGTAKIGAAVAVGVTFVGLDRAGFKATGERNSPQALAGLELLFLALPGALNILAALLLVRYPLTRQRHAEIREALERQPAVG
jgi:Na+/melibiose symporter-like transporter